MKENYKFTNFHCTAPQSFVKRKISLGQDLFYLKKKNIVTCSGLFFHFNILNNFNAHLLFDNATKGRSKSFSVDFIDYNTSPKNF